MDVAQGLPELQCGNEGSATLILRTPWTEVILQDLVDVGRTLSVSTLAVHNFQKFFIYANGYLLFRHPITTNSILFILLVLCSGLG